MPISKVQKERLKKLGGHAKALRKAKGMTLKGLANSIDKDFQSIYRLEKGDVNPSFLYLEELCEGLGTTLPDLLDGLD